MRSSLLLIVVAFGSAWILDAYKYDGRYSQAVWQQTIAEGRHVKDSMQRAVERAMSGQCALCD
jgi:hypothetical protein